MHRIIIAWLVGWFAVAAVRAEPIWQTVAVPRPDGSDFPASMARPASDAGAPFPAVVFAHGWIAPPFIYSRVVRDLADHGYVVIVPWSALELFPDHAGFAEDLRHCLTFLVDANTDATSELVGRIQVNALGLTGHSMGGGASLLAAADDPRVRAVGAINPAQSFQVSVLAAVPRIGVPVNLIAGTDDDFTPFWQHAGPLFLFSSPPTVLTLVRGGSHFGVLDFPIPPPLGDAGSLPHPEEHDLVKQRLRLFLDATLKGDVPAFLHSWASDPRVSNLPKY